MAPSIGPATYHLLVSQVRRRVADYAAKSWTGLGSWRDADVDRFVDAIVPVVTGGQRQVASLTDAYLSQQVAAMYGVSPAPSGVAAEDIAGARLRNGADPREVYRRPAIEMYTALRDGQSLTSAVQLGKQRVTSLVDTDLQLAKTHAARASLRDSPAAYYRRTLTGAENCALCVVASTQRYRTDELLPIHPGCDCGVDPVAGNVSHVLDPEQLEEVHAAVERVTGRPADRSARDYTNLVVVHQHGEYGPIIGFRGQSFTGPGDVG